MNKLLNPPTVFACVFPACIFVLLVVVFCLGLQKTPVAYAIVFPLSTYALSLWVVKAPRFARWTKTTVKHSAPVRWFSSTALGSRLIDDERFRVRLGITASIVISVPYAALCLYLGASAFSLWFATLGAYYLVLGLQTAMLASFSTEGAGFTMMMNAITGGIVFLIVACVAVVMNVKGSKLKAQIESR